MPYLLIFRSKSLYVTPANNIEMKQIYNTSSVSLIAFHKLLVHYSLMLQLKL